MGAMLKISTKPPIFGATYYAILKSDYHQLVTVHVPEPNLCRFHENSSTAFYWKSHKRYTNAEQASDKILDWQILLEPLSVKYVVLTQMSVA